MNTSLKAFFTLLIPALVLLVILWPTPPTNYTIESSNPSTEITVDYTTNLMVEAGFCQVRASIYFADSGKVYETIGLQFINENERKDTILLLQLMELEVGVPGTLYQAVTEIQTGDALVYAGAHKIQVLFDGNCIVTVSYDFVTTKIGLLMLMAVIIAMFVSLRQSMNT